MVILGLHASVPSRNVDGERLARGRVRRGNTAGSHVAALPFPGTCARRVDGWSHVVGGADGGNRVPCSVRSAPVIGLGVHDDRRTAAAALRRWAGPHGRLYLRQGQERRCDRALRLHAVSQ
jgi:hypothetical protein